VAQGFCADAGAVGHEKYGSGALGHGGED
jgi:hypothetical protein